MAIYGVYSPLPVSRASLTEALERTYPQRHLKVGEGFWLVADIGSAEDVSGRIGVTGTPANPNAKIDSTVVVEVASYYGRSNPSIWSWIKTHWEASASA